MRERGGGKGGGGYTVSILNENFKTPIPKLDI